MVDPADESPEEFTPTPEHEYQDSHYHDEDPEIVNDEVQRSAGASLTGKKNRRPPPRRRYIEE